MTRKEKRQIAACIFAISLGIGALLGLDYKSGYTEALLILMGAHVALITEIIYTAKKNKNGK